MAPGRAPQSPVPGRVPLAVVVVDESGLVSHWSTGARRLFGPAREDAVGRPATDLLPVSGALPEAPDARSYGDESAYDGLGPDLESSLDGRASYPAAGRARLEAPRPAAHRRPVVGLPAGRPRARSSCSCSPPTPAGCTPTTCPTGIRWSASHPASPCTPTSPAADELARGLPAILPSMSVGESARIVSQVLELGYPVLEFSLHDRVPVTADWGVPRRAERKARREEAARAAAAGLPAPRRAPDDGASDDADDLEYAAVREHLEFLNEVSGRIGSSLDLSRTIVEVSRAVVPRFTDVAGTYLREQVVAGEGFPEGPPDATTLWHRVALEHTDEPGRWDDVVPVGESMPFPAHTPFFQCMTTGQPVLVPRITEEMGNAIASQFEKRDIRPLITDRSMLVVPLKARNVVLGFMILLRHRERPVFNDMDRVTGAELAARAGLVLDNARMYTYQESVAETLQDSMLPHIEPAHARL